jgi:hypothetical protein
MGSRLSLQSLLEGILGTTNVYFQPPETIKLSYPCMVYKLRNVIAKYADDVPYMRKKQYSVTVITLDPDTDIPDKVLALASTSFERHFIMSGLNHYVININF